MCDYRKNDKSNQGHINRDTSGSGICIKNRSQEPSLNIVSTDENQVDLDQVD